MKGNIKPDTPQHDYLSFFDPSCARAQHKSLQRRVWSLAFLSAQNQQVRQIHVFPRNHLAAVLPLHIFPLTTIIWALAALQKKARPGMCSSLPRWSSHWTDETITQEQYAGDIRRHGRPSFGPFLPTDRLAWPFKVNVKVPAGVIRESECEKERFSTRRYLESMTHAPANMTFQRQITLACGQTPPGRKKDNLSTQQHKW